ncbi:glutamate-1-semialdehyde-2,1-aminomutase domain protein [Mycobacterium xenopi 4042]|uniref:Glutamate-1-semialdehyde-2,1-aminomutase domain protein n=1 Tax=Mycobacterium xenopi 4042 TaxID=1299334 RepID=X7YUN5_MYCXE|nr:glutamate-1-semialdehyde-2,1-aminomutase domain protein [Mycobacterium xenopi 4042]
MGGTPRFITQASGCCSPTPTATAMSTWSALGPMILGTPPGGGRRCAESRADGCRSARRPRGTELAPRSSAGWHRWSRSAWSTPAPRPR